MKHLLVFGACATVAALLLMRILPELAIGPEKMAEPVEPEVVLSTPDASRQEMSVTAVTLLLPSPPGPKLPPSVDTYQETEATSEREAAKVISAPESEPLPDSALAGEALVKATPLPEPRPISKPVIVEKQVASQPSENVETQHDVLPTADRAARTENHFVTPGAIVEAEGRVLLRILEHGSGPMVEIAWPVSVIQHLALYRLFEACYGMEIAVIDSRGRLYNRSGKAGRPWQPNLDRYSGLARKPFGHLTSDEKDGIARIRTFHGGLRATDNVRLFPRRLDALLLGGLKALIGAGYAEAIAIRAHYRRDGDSVLVEGIRLDGRPILGRIDLSNAGRHCRSDAWS